jgi:hypothetical protein
MRNRRGSITISDALYRNNALEIASALAGIKFLPCRVEHLWDINSFQMIGLSPEFSEVGEGEKAIEYIITFDTDESGAIKASLFNGVNSVDIESN